MQLNEQWRYSHVYVYTYSVPGQADELLTIAAGVDSDYWRCRFHAGVA